MRPTVPWRLALLAVLALTAGVTLLAAGMAQAQTSEQVPRALPDTIPIFPLPDVTLLPNTTQPFHIFEPRYREMVAAALAGDSIIGMVALQPGWEADYEGRPDIYQIGCAGVIVASEQLPDGGYNIVLRGLSKFEIQDEDDSRSYRLARVETRAEAAEPDPVRLEQRRRQLEEAIGATYPRLPLPSASVPDAEAIDGLAIALPIEPAERQELLESDGPGERAAMLLEILRGSVRAER